MKKINFTVGSIFLILAMLFTIDIGWHVVQEKGWSASSIVSTIFFYCLSAFYFYLGVRTTKMEKERMAKLTESYEVLMALYDEIKSNENPEDELSRRMFVIGVHDFGIEAFDIADGIYPPEMQHKAETMIDNLMRLVAEFT